MSVSLNFREYAFAQESGVFPIALIDISHPDISPDIRLSTDPTQRIYEGDDDFDFQFNFLFDATDIDTGLDVIYGTVSNGQTYFFFPCSLVLPDDTDDGPGQIKMQFDNIHRDYTTTIRSITGKPTVDVSIVMSNALDTVEQQWPEFFICDIQYDATTIILTMDMEILTQEPFPYGSYTPGAFPGLFRGL